MKIRLLIADDHSILRKGLKQLFEMEVDLAVTGEAANGDEVLNRVREQEFDLLLLDMTMNGSSGMDLIRRIKSIKPELPILMLSMHKVSQMAILALKAGANGYVTKDSEPEDLLKAIRKVAEGGKYIDSVMAEEIAYETATPDQSQPHIHLSAREFEVFRMLIAGTTIKEIAWRLDLSEKTVSTYKTRILGKMNLNSVADLIRYAIQFDVT